jgi:hypothetical protein
MKFLKGILQAIGGVLALIWVWMGSVFAFAGLFGPWIFLAVVLFVVGLVLTLLGFDLDQVDLWLEAHGGFINAVGSGLFRLFCGLVLLLCGFAVFGGLYQQIAGKKPARGEDERIGFGMIAVSAVIGYFAFFGTFGA